MRKMNDNSAAETAAGGIPLLQNRAGEMPALYNIKQEDSIMKIKFLGTAAAEGMPALFCQCDNCQKARKNGGRDIRTRSQAIIDNTLLIDFNADTYMHILNYNIDLSRIEHCVITHAHSDHCYPNDFNMRGSGFARFKDERKPLNVYGSETVVDKCKGICNLNEAIAAFHTVEAFKPFVAGGYTVTPLPALHGEDSGPLMYMIEKDGKAMLYAHDTGLFFEEVYDYFKEKKIYFDFVTLDCCETLGFSDWPYHMTVEGCETTRERLKANGHADDKTIFYLNHFSHNATPIIYDELSAAIAGSGFGISYDGLEVEF